MRKILVRVYGIQIIVLFNKFDQSSNQDSFLLLAFYQLLFS
ncbi:hypothetical protein [uncultured Sunxiuqinia sp.]|nr:hypothetical protein [uncultured Sunxiuqinia sp.]